MLILLKNFTFQSPTVSGFVPEENLQQASSKVERLKLRDGSFSDTGGWLKLKAQNFFLYISFNFSSSQIPYSLNSFPNIHENENLGFLSRWEFPSFSASSDFHFDIIYISM